MKRTAVFAMLLAAAVASADGIAGVTKKFELTQNNAVVKAGEVIKTRLVFECEEGAVLGSWKTVVIRKNAPEAFFAKPEVKINKAKTAPYDSIWFCSDKNNFPCRLTAGECPVKLNTTGMSAGDYAIIVQGWALKDRKSYYPAAIFYLTITEEDNGKFAPTEQEFPAASRILPPSANAKPWYKSCTVKPAETVYAAPGDKIAYSCEFAAPDTDFFGGYSMILLRKEAAPGFFDRPGLKIKRRHPDKNDDYDTTAVVAFKHMASVPEAKFDFELDTTDFPSGEYVLRLEIRLVDRATGKTRYPVILLPLSLR